MSLLDFGRLAQAPLAEEPFRHLLLTNVVQPGSLDSILAGLPHLRSGGSFPLSAVQLSAHARRLMDDLQGQQFRDLIASRFALSLGDARTMVTLRGQSRGKDGRIHRDSTAKLVTVLLYLNSRTAAWGRPEGCLRLLRSASDIDDFAVEVSPVDGTLLAFPNGPTTWHGHKPFVGRRYVVQLNYMRNDSAARGELRRHYLSSLMKRVIA